MTRYDCLRTKRAYFLTDEQAVHGEIVEVDFKQGKAKFKCDNGEVLTLPSKALHPEADSVL